MSQQVIILAIVWPLLAGVLTALLPAREKVLSVWSIANLAFCNLLSLSLLREVIQTGTLSYQISGWAPPLGIELRATVFSAFLSWLISLIGFLGVLGGRCTWKEQIGERLPHFMALLFLLLASFQGLALSNDAFNLYVMLEISSLATYGMIAFGGGRAYLATFHYIVMGTIGASFYLLGVGYLYIKTGTLNISDLAEIIAQQELSRALMMALAFLVTGLLLKMAVFPLHFWLPNAYTYAPAQATVVIAPLSTKLAVFLMFRVMTDIFGGLLPKTQADWSLVVVLFATVGILFGTSLALAKRDLKKIFASLIVAEAGYMLGGLWLSDSRGTIGALFHLLNDAVATLVLFLVVIAVRNTVGGKNLGDLKGLFQKSPLTAAALVLVAFNLIGVPPTAGFFSKATLITGAVASGRWEYVIALLLASLGNLVIFFRIIEHAYFSPAEGDETKRVSAGQWSGAFALLCGLLLVGMGLFSQPIMGYFIKPVVLP